MENKNNCQSDASGVLNFFGILKNLDWSECEKEIKNFREEIENQIN